MCEILGPSQVFAPVENPKRTKHEAEEQPYNHHHLSRSIGSQRERRRRKQGVGWLLFYQALFGKVTLLGYLLKGLVSECHLSIQTILLGGDCIVVGRTILVEEVGIVLLSLFVFLSAFGFKCIEVGKLCLGFSTLVVVKTGLQAVDGVVGHHGCNHRVLTCGRDGDDARLHVLSALDVAGQPLQPAKFLFSKQNITRWLFPVIRLIVERRFLTPCDEVLELVECFDGLDGPRNIFCLEIIVKRHHSRVLECMDFGSHHRLQEGDGFGDVGEH